MARYIGAGNTEVFYVATLTTPSAPTAAQINAGTDLTGFLTDGGASTPLDGSTVDIADMSSRFNKTQAGTFGGQTLTAEFFRDTSADTAYTTLPRDTVGYLVFSREGFATAGTAASGDKVDVWPITVISRNMADIARNEAAKFVAECAVTDVPDENVSVV